MKASLTEGMSLHGATTLLAEIIRVSPRPLTHVLEELAGISLSLRVKDDGRRELTDDERFRLTAEGMRKGRYRAGMLAGEFAVAYTELLWLEQRTPWTVCRALDEGVLPAGKVMTGMHRDDRRSLAVYPSEHDIAVRSSAVLYFGDVPAGIAYEAVTVSFCEAWRDGTSSRHGKLPVDYTRKDPVM